MLTNIKINNNAASYVSSGPLEESGYSLPGTGSLRKG